MRNTGRWVRAALTVGLLLLGLRAFRDELAYVPLVGDIDTAVHEFGHYLFMPFGEFMTVAGGSIFQVLVPLVFLGYFLYGKAEHRDRHAATVCLWWAAMNVLSVAIYAADARAGELVLLGGATGQDDPEGHDFYNIFSRLGVLNRDTIYAVRLRATAWLLFAVSVGAGFWFAIRPVAKPAAKEG